MAGVGGGLAAAAVTAEVRRFPIRHHGPISARAVRAGLSQWTPDAVLLEGPPEAACLLEWVGSPQLKPPVAMMIAVRDAPERSVAYPLASWSPEWVTLRWAAQTGVPLTFMDLPLTQRLAQKDPASTPRSEAMGTLAALAGHRTADAWWESLLAETERPFEGFAAVEAALAEARRADLGSLRGADGTDALREAAMRLAIRRVVATGARRIAVVCGAWHAPALADLSGVTRDRAALRGLARVRVDASWIPWTPQRMQRSSGYGAGVDSPGWAAVVAAGGEGVAARWVARWAAALRDHGVRAGSAQVLDAVRLANELSDVRGRTTVTRDDLDDAVAALFPVDAVDAVRSWVVLGDAMGRVPVEAPAVPLVRSVRAAQRSLRLRVRAEPTELTLDLRQARDRAKSELLHQLALLQVGWGRVQDPSDTALGTFRERWVVCWTASCERALIAASPWGVTACEAAERRVIDSVDALSDVSQVVERIQHALRAGLPDAPGILLDAVDRMAAGQPEWMQLLHASPGLVDVAVYGDVRGLGDRLRSVARRLLTRGLASVLQHASGIDDDAAGRMVSALQSARRGVQGLSHVQVTALWGNLLRDLCERPRIHPRLNGLCARWRLEADPSFDARSALTRALGAPHADDVAQWLEGWLHGRAHALVHRPELWAPLDAWLASLSNTAFERVLPVLRRTFARLDASVRRDVAQLVGSGVSPARPPRPYDAVRAEPALATLRQWIGPR